MRTPRHLNIVRAVVAALVLVSTFTVAAARPAAAAPPAARVHAFGGLPAFPELVAVNKPVIGITTTTSVAHSEPVTTAEEILAFQQLVRMVPIADSVARYAVDLVRMTRPTDATTTDFVKKYVNFGASVRDYDHIPHHIPDHIGAI